MTRVDDTVDLTARMIPDTLGERVCVLWERGKLANMRETNPWTSEEVLCGILRITDGVTNHACDRTMQLRHQMLSVGVVALFIMECQGAINRTADNRSWGCVKYVVRVAGSPA